MFDQIIVPVDGSEPACRAVSLAATLAERFGASIMLVTVVTAREPVPDADGLASIADAAGIRDASTRLLFDEDPGGRLAEFAGSYPASLVCCSTRGHGALRQFVLGSVASQIVRDGSRPVLLIGPHHDPARRPGDGPVLVSLDGSRLAEAAVPVALDWARLWATPIVLAQVVSPIAEAPTAAARIPKGLVATDSYLPRLASSLPGDVAWVVTADERPQRALLDLVDERGASLVAMATHGETGLARIALGSVANAVVAASPVPVLVVRPGDLDS